MALAIPLMCIPNEGIDACIPGSPLSVLTLIEVRNRLGIHSNANRGAFVPPERLAESLNLTDEQVRAGLAYYHQNRDAFDEELSCRKAASDAALSALFAANGNQNRFGEIIGAWPGDETDEEIDAALERMS